MNMTISGKDAQSRRKGKADGYMPEVRRGVGVHVPKKHKEKEKQKWKKEVKSQY